eukprot:6060211-Pleurochrysis_carterae.AAC.1
MDAAKAERHGDVLGLGGYCHGRFFSLPLSAQTRGANSIATLELMALVAAIATFREFFTTSLASFSNQSRSLLPSTWRITERRTMRRS